MAPGSDMTNAPLDAARSSAFRWFVVLNGFKGRLALALLATAMITVVASTVALLSFQRFGTLVGQASDETLPLLTGSLALSESSTLLAATAPVLAASRDVDQVAGLQRQIDDFSGETRRALALLRARYPGETVERIVQVSEAMSSALKAQQRITLRRLALVARKQARLAELERSQQQFLGSVTPLFGSTRGRLGEVTRQAADVNHRQVEDLTEKRPARFTLLDQVGTQAETLALLLHPRIGREGTGAGASGRQPGDDEGRGVIAASQALDRLWPKLVESLGGDLRPGLARQVAALQAYARAAADGRTDAGTDIHALHLALAEELRDQRQTEARALTQAGVMLRYQTGVAFSSLFGRIIDTFRQILSLRTEGDTLFTVLRVGAEAADEVGVSQAASQFNRSLAAFQRELAGFVADAGEGDQAAVAALNDINQAIIGLGQGGDSLFDLHREELDLAERTATALMANQTTAGYLQTHVNRLVAAIEADVAGRRRTLDQQVESGKATLLLLCLGALLLAAVIAGHTVQKLGAHERSLRQALDQAEAANRAKSDFLATMSHEMRTPLNGVLGLTELLSDADGVRDSQEICHLITDSAQRLLQIIDDILDYSMMEGGEQPLEAYTFAPEMPAQSVLSLLSKQARDKGLGLICEVDSKTPAAVIGDPGRLHKVLLHLVTNAIKFTSAGQVTVRIAEQADTPAGPVIDGRRTMATLRYEIEDTGIGIAEGDLGRLFSPFTQLDGTLTRQYGGTGLGLALCKRMIEMLGGSIGVHSMVQQGSTFWFTLRLPLAEAEDRPDTGGAPIRLEIYASDSGDRTGAVSNAVPRGPGPGAGLDKGPAVRSDERGGEAPADNGSITGGGGTAEIAEPSGSAPAQAGDGQTAAPRAMILVVEDNPTNSRVSVRLLRNAGYRVEVASNGGEAVNAVAWSSFDLVLMDVQMPEMDGLTATRCIRALPAPAGLVPIVALTANALRGDREVCLAAGMDDYLAKPIDRNRLLEVIEHRIRVAAERRQASGAVLGQAPAVAVSGPGRAEFSPDQERRAGPESRELDAEMLKELIETFGPGEARDVMAAFLRETRNRIGLIVKAAEQGNGAVLERETHTLKGNAANLGMAKLGQIAARVVAACRSGALAEGIVLAADLPVRFERACAELIRDYPDLMMPSAT